MLGSLLSLGIVYAQGALKTFPDVDYNDYYAESLNDMYGRGVIYGYDNGKFGPHDPLTRAQLVTILKRYDDQLVNAYHSGGTGNLQSLICLGISRQDILDSTSEWSENAGDLAALYDETCTLP